MSRDEQFEVQYLLSLMVVVIGLFTSNVNQILSNIVAIGFLFISSIHLLLLTSRYSIEKGTEVQLLILGRIKWFSRGTLQLTTLGFMYVLFHAISYSVLAEYAEPVWQFSKKRVQSVITFGLPIVPVSIVSGTFIQKVWKPFRFSRDISVNITPSHLRIYPEFDDGEPVLIEILNQGGQDYDLTFSIDLPESVVAEISHDTHLDEYREDITLSNDRTPIHLRLRHNLREERKEVIRVRAEHEYGEIEKRIECILRP